MTEQSLHLLPPLRDEARSIWQAAIDAIRPARLVEAAVRVEGASLVVCGQYLPVPEQGRLCVVGGGKAAGEMAAALETLLRGSPLEARLEGQVNVPDAFSGELRRIGVCHARPEGHNLPTDRAVAGTADIVARLRSRGAQDVCMFLVSGGGSALLCLPRPGVSLQQKNELTQALVARGASIQEINRVRRQLSQVKGGGLGAFSTAGCNVALIISDVIDDDPCDIASGPTCPDPRGNRAPEVLRRYGIDAAGLDAAMRGYLFEASDPRPETVCNHVIGSNAVAVAHAARRAAELGYRVIELGSRLDGSAEAEGCAMARRLLDAQSGDDPRALCFVGGGEPTVSFEGCANPGLGGRNQHYVLAALTELSGPDLPDFCLLAGGTDGEDGPTDAAGAFVDAALLRAMHEQGIEASDYLRRYDSHAFFTRLGGLLKCGLTGTNVADLHVALLRRR